MDYGLTDILTLLGALGLFLYGMKVMSDALMELAGDRPLLVEGAGDNLKITRPEDLALAAFYLEQQEGG